MKEKKKRVKGGVKSPKKEDKYKSEELVYDSDSDSDEVANAVNGKQGIGNPVNISRIYTKELLHLII